MSAARKEYPTLMALCVVLFIPFTVGSILLGAWCACEIWRLTFAGFHGLPPVGMPQAFGGGALSAWMLSGKRDAVSDDTDLPTKVGRAIGVALTPLMLLAGVHLMLWVIS